jgi:hypothetical protein
MIELNDRQAADFYRRSYQAVDGLWFIKVEEAYGFDNALDIDDEVWKVLPKIQARMLKGLMKTGDKIQDLLECFTMKLKLDGFVFEARVDDSGTGFEMIIQKCPWHDAMIKSGREHLSGKVGTRICNTECSVWASEFGDDIVGKLGSQICTGAEFCEFQFSRSA